MNDPDPDGPPPEPPYAPAERSLRYARRPILSLPARPLIPDKARLVLCKTIAPAVSLNKFTDDNFAERFAALTRPLPLGGRAALGKTADGGFQLISRLRAAMPWMEAAIARIELQLRIQRWAGRPWLHFRPLCLVGPPGAGKSHLARLIGELAGIGHAALDLGGTSDNRALEGTARGFTQAQPAWPVMMIDALRLANPVLVLEEVDKAGGSDRNGRSLDTLLALLEPMTAARFHDKCLLADVDLSHINWLVTCNAAHDLPAPLRSHLDIIAVEPPGPEHFALLERAITADLARRWQVAPGDLPELPPAAVKVLRAHFAQHRSARSLRRHIEALIGALVPDRPARLH